jgi:hypothetical protein
MIEYRDSKGRRVSADQFIESMRRDALDLAFAHLEKRAHGAAASIVDPETGRHADVFVRRAGDQGIVISTKGSPAFARELERRLGVEQGTVMTERASSDAPPVVYLAHASEDKAALAKPLAELLMTRGIDVWLDEWEISAGDSLRRKMEQGLGSCSHFVVLLTPRSIGKPWVETEIDAGFVRAVGGQSRFIGLRIGVGIDALSPFLATLSCPEIDLSRSEEVDKLIADIHGVSRKPALGEKPRYVRTLPKETGGWSTSALAVAEYLVRQSETGCKFDPQVTVAVASAATGLPETDIRLGVLDLVDAGLVEWMKTSGSQTFYPLYGLFIEFDARFLGFDNERDAVAIANWLINEGRTDADVGEIAKAFPDFSDRRLNSALGYLEGAKAVKVQRYLSTTRWTYSALSIDDHTLRFVKNRT